MKALKGPKKTEPYFLGNFSSAEIGFYIPTLLRIENVQKGLTVPKSTTVEGNVQFRGVSGVLMFYP